ncbi:helix-turn-helix domain-containing protein [Jeotgalibacillus salarius]|uniref:GAF domain-containing protein n=1 Tax=Jeotgalibacillus salarius TaxID=546023 RepID=A0A4Y8LFX2_9BACL|nr:helix-turn-helix domain-containing protein [Jeotgalibacillus salarius]TFE01672.1 GAF domain-containing protein [Jeotgalibacillus salarius]
MDTEKQLRSLINSVQVMTSTLNLDEVLDQLIKEVLNVIDGSNASVLFLFDEKIGKLYAKAAAGFDMKYLKHALLEPGEGMSGKTFVSQQGRIFSTHDDTLKGMTDINEETKGYYSKARGDMEYPASAICVPLMTKKGCIGVLTVDIYEENVVFTDQDLKLLETFAVQAVIAIENATLFSKNERTQRVHETLSRVSLSQGGLEEITKTLASLVNAEVIVFNEFFDLLEVSSENASARGRLLIQQYPHVLTNAMAKEKGSVSAINDHHIQERIYFFPVRTDQRAMGLISIYLAERDVLDPLDQFAIEQASMIFALEMNRRDKSSYDALTYSGYVLDQLLYGKLDELTVNEIARATSGAVEGRQFILVQLTIEEALLSLREISVKKETLLRMIRRKLVQFPYKAFILDQNLDVIFMFTYPEYIEEASAYERIRILFAQLVEEVRQAAGLSVLIGIGRTVNQLEEVKVSANDASKCVDYLLTKNKNSSLLAYFELGFQRLFLKTEVRELEAYVEDTIGKLKEFDNAHNGSLMITLSVYLELNQNMRQTAEALFIHVNTVKYRLKCIKEVLDIEAIQGKEAFELQLAVNIDSFLEK